MVGQFLPATTCWRATVMRVVPAVAVAIEICFESIAVALISSRAPDAPRIAGATGLIGPDA